MWYLLINYFLKLKKKIMKKNFLFLATAMFAMMMFACTQKNSTKEAEETVSVEEVVSDSIQADTTVVAADTVVVE